MRVEVEGAHNALLRCRRLGAALGSFVRISLEAQGRNEYGPRGTPRRSTPARRWTPECKETMSSLFSSLTSAARALDAQRFGLDVTGQNIANVNTPGYTRRVIDMAAVPPGVQSRGRPRCGCRRRPVRARHADRAPAAAGAAVGAP